MTRRYSHLIGPWPARVFSRALCGVFGRNIRLDVVPLRRGGGFRMTFSGIGGPRSAAFVAAEIRPRNRGGVWIDDRYCGRLGR
jgi:hypothetical protein